jgi:hypothetical protein
MWFVNSSFVHSIKAAAEMSQDAESTAFRTQAGALISLVDDDESFRTSTSRLLRVMGFTVQSFSSAEA